MLDGIRARDVADGHEEERPSEARGQGDELERIIQWAIDVKAEHGEEDADVYIREWI